MARLATHVHVHKDGASHVFGPDDEVPEWAAALITNPAAWAEAPTRTVSRSTDPAPATDAKPAVKRAAPRRKAAPGGSVQ